MYVITVLFSIGAEHTSAFLQAIVANARSWLKNRVADNFVCVSDRDPTDVFLYEVYDSKAAFDAHLASAHYRQFTESTPAWVIAKVINVFERTYPRSST